MKNIYIENSVNAQGAVMDIHIHTRTPNCHIKQRWRWQKSLLLFGVFSFLGCFNLFAQSNTKPPSTEIIPCGGSTMSINDPVNPDNIPNTSPQVIQVCCPTGPASCPKRKITVCWHGLEAHADYKVGYV